MVSVELWLNEIGLRLEFASGMKSFYEWRCDYDVTIAWMINALSSMKQVAEFDRKEMVILFDKDLIGSGMRFYKSVL